MFVAALLSLSGTVLGADLADSHVPIVVTETDRNVIASKAEPNVVYRVPGMIPLL